MIFCAADAAVVLAVGLFGDLRFDRLASAASSAASGEVLTASGKTLAAATGSSGMAAAWAAGAHSPPSEAAIPDDEHGATIRLGRTIFTDTARVASPYVGNDLRCASCHLDAGRRAGAAPMASAFVRYPTWSGKMQRVDTLEMRLQECLVFSMNGKAPPAGDPMLVALQAYAGWLATGAPVASQPLAGGGLPPLAAPSAPADAQRGDRVYAQQCASCHGGNGAGQRAGEWQTVLPLWGARSFNRGAGMAQPATAAAFIRANMPLGARGTLSEQEALDVATFLDGHDRPADPREPAATVAADDALARAR